MPETKIYRLPSAQKRRIWLTRKLRFWPALLWILLAVFVVYGIGGARNVVQVFGVVDYPDISVAATETGKIENIFVTVGQKIVEGDALIKLSSLEIDYEIASLKADAEEEQQATQRQFFNTMQSINADIRQLKLQQAQAEGELAILKEEGRRLEGLLTRRLIDAAEVATNRMRIVSLETAGNKYPEFLKALESEKATLASLENNSPKTTEDNRAVQLSILQERAKSLSISANNSGVISNVLRNPGDVVLAGETVLELLGSDAPVVKGFIPLSVHDSIQLGKTVYLVDKNDKGQVFEGTIVSISPSVIGIVDTSTPIVPRTVKGRMFTVESPATSRWIESEQVIILLDKPSDSIIQKWLLSLSSWLCITRHN